MLSYARIHANDAVNLIWHGFMIHPGVCTSWGGHGHLPFHYPWGVAPLNTDYNTHHVCRLIYAEVAFGVVYSIVLMVWFGWTLWLATKVTKTMGEPWTRDLVIKKVSMGKMAKLHQWREGEDIGLGKVHSDTASHEVRESA
jgi:hypothetical protein